MFGSGNKTIVTDYPFVLSYKGEQVHARAVKLIGNANISTNFANDIIGNYSIHVFAFVRDNKNKEVKIQFD